MLTFSTEIHKQINTLEQLFNKLSGDVSITDLEFASEFANEFNLLATQNNKKRVTSTSKKEFFDVEVQEQFPENNIDNLLNGTPVVLFSNNYEELHIVNNETSKDMESSLDTDFFFKSVLITKENNTNPKSENVITKENNVIADKEIETYSKNIHYDSEKDITIKKNMNNLNSNDITQNVTERYFSNVKISEVPRAVWYSAINTTRGSINVARIMLNPNNLGNVEVEINLKKEIINFKVENNDALIAMKENIGKLKEMFVNSGMKEIDIKFEKIETHNNTNHSQQFNKQSNEQHKNNDGKGRREFMNNVFSKTSTDSIEKDFATFIEEYV